MDRLIPKQIDFDIAERIASSGPIKRTKPTKTKRTPRAASSYRQNGAVVNAEVKKRPYRGSIDLNRSVNWPDAENYKAARDASPSTEPVR